MANDSVKIINSSLAVDAVRDLRQTFSGTLILPGEVGYDDARLVWNGMIDRFPAAIAQCTGPKDVSLAIKFARTHDLPITVKGGGHGVAGKAVSDGSLMIDCSPMRTIEIDPVRRTARAGAGVTWGEYDTATSMHGLASTGGVVASTGIAGLTLGGGIGFLLRRCGLSCDNLIAAEVVTAAGETLIASGTDNPDLFWALRGGGGNFGVVTSFTFRLHEIGPRVLGGIITHPASDARSVAKLYREVTSTAPDELTVNFGFGVAHDGMPTVHLVVCYCGSLEAGEIAVRRLREYGKPLSDTIAPTTYLDMQLLFAETFPAGTLNYWKSGFLAELSDQVIETMIAAYATAPSPNVLLNLEHLQGAFGRIEPSATAFYERAAAFNLLVTGCWTDPNETERTVSWIRDSFATLQPHTMGSVYINYVDAGDDARTVSAYGGNYARLAEIKAKYDPDNIFRHNHNIAPASRSL